jgi:hypothetical protein
MKFAALTPGQRILLRPVTVDVDGIDAIGMLKIAAAGTGKKFA